MADKLVATLDKAGVRKISTDLWGVFFEDISYSGDGGVNSERVQKGAVEARVEQLHRLAQDRARRLVRRIRCGGDRAGGRREPALRDCRNRQGGRRADC